MASNYETEEPQYYIFQHKSLQDLNLPLKGSLRVKFTCFNVSNNFIALGTNAGSIHIFRRSSLRHYRLVNAKVFPQAEPAKLTDVAVITVSFSGNEKYFAAALSSGYLVVWAMNVDKRQPLQVVRKFEEHKGTTITSLCWHLSSTKLFIGDNSGRVTGLEVSSGKIRTHHTIVKQGPSIVQMDFVDEILLISNLKRCIYYETDKDDVTQLGTKTRDGPYGACFVPGSETLACYCARPGARLWKVDNQGHVLSTQQYKHLFSIPVTSIVGNIFKEQNKTEMENKPCYIFPKLLVIRDELLLTWTRQTMSVLDPTKGRLVLWNNQLNDIMDVCCRRQDFYVFHDGGKVTRYSLLGAKECVAKLFVIGEWLQCAKVVVQCKNQIIPIKARDHVPHYVLSRLKEILKSDPENQEIFEKIVEIEHSLEVNSDEPSTKQDVSLVGSLLLDDSDTCSVISDTDSIVTTIDSGVEDVEETSQPSDKKEKLSRLKGLFQEQLKDFSFDSVLLAGAQAAGNLQWSNPLSVHQPKSDVWSSTYPSQTFPINNETSPHDVGNNDISSKHDSSGSWENNDSDSEIMVERDESLSKEKKRRKHKVINVDLTAPMQPTDLINMKTIRTTQADLRELSSKQLIADSTEKERLQKCASDESLGERKEKSRTKANASNHDVVGKARNFLKRLAPEEKDVVNKPKDHHNHTTRITTPLEVKSLIIKSTETRKSVRDSTILYNPESLKTVLTAWLAYLEHAMKAVERIYPKTVGESQAYCVSEVGKVLSPAVKADLTRFLDADNTSFISQLATMCFNMALYHATLPQATPSHDDITIATVDGFITCASCDHKPTNQVTESRSSTDLAKLQFLESHFQLLDYQVLRAPIIVYCGQHHKLLHVILTSIDNFTVRDVVDDAIDVGNTKLALQLLRERPEQYKNRLLRHIFRLYYLVPREVSRLCADIYPQFHPWEVVLVCLSSSTNLVSNCSDFLIYTTHLLQKHGKSRKNSFDFFDEIYRSRDFLVVLFHAALLIDDSNEGNMRCHCEWPRHNSHKTSLQYEDLLMRIIHYFKNPSDASWIQTLLLISWNHGFWHGCIEIFVLMGLRREALTLVLRLGDMSLMNSKQTWGRLPCKIDDWSYAYNFMTNLLREKDVEFDISRKHRDAESSIATATTETNHKNLDNTAEERRLFSEKKAEDGRSEDYLTANLDSVLRRLDINSENVDEHSKMNNTSTHTCIKGLRECQLSNFKSFCSLILQNVGSDETLRIISQNGFHNLPLTHDFYYKCILNSLVENGKSALCHLALNEVNQYMWTSKNTTLSPQINQMKEIEFSRGSKEDNFKGSDSLVYKRTLEDAACNWGVNLSISKTQCGACPLSLCEKTAVSNRGLMIFPCGHVFHRDCCTDDYCLTCFNAKLKLSLH